MFIIGLSGSKLAFYGTLLFSLGSKRRRMQFHYFLKFPRSRS